jgi:hypothetical protein
MNHQFSTPLTMAPATPHRTVPRSHSNSKQPSKTKNNDRQKKIRFWATLVLGFVLGVFTQLLNFAYESDAQLQQANAANSGAGLDLLTFTSRPHTSSTKLRVGANNSTPTDNDEIVDFQRVDRVVIATKIHGENVIDDLKQSLCLFKYAYNDRLNYDILVFSSEPVPESVLAPIRRMVAPANITFVVDNPGLQTMLQAMTPKQQAHLLDRCQKTFLEEISWDTKCLEIANQANTTEEIAYTWQSEFRALHIWKHAALAPYKYMLWMDSDGFCSKKWEKDPIATMARNDLALFFDNFPQGASQGYEWPGIFQRAFNQTVCMVKLGVENATALGGRTLTASGGNCKRPRL